MPETRQFPDLDPDDGGIVDLNIYSGNSVEMRFYKLNGAGHTLPSLVKLIADWVEVIAGKQNHDIEYVWEVWEFF